MKTLKKLAFGLVLAAVAAGAYLTGTVDHARDLWVQHAEAKKAADEPPKAEPLPPVVTAVTVTRNEFVETVLVTGSLVAREEILVSPEIEGLRVLELKAEEGDEVKKGQVLAILVSETLEAQNAESDAALARANAAIARAQSQIAEAEARLSESQNAVQRARPLKKSGWISDATLDQREASAGTARAQLASAQGGLRVAEAEKAQVEARRRELDWRRAKSEVKSPADGLVSRRTARIGGMAVSAGQPMFSIIENGEIELDAEIPEHHLAKMRPGQNARIDVAGAGIVDGTVRLISPQIDKATRLGRVRILLDVNPQLRIGAFGRGNVETTRATSLAVPQSAILYGTGSATVQVVVDGKISVRSITTGLSAGGLVEVRSGLSDGDVIVAKAGTFLRDGDLVRALLPDAKISEQIQ